jgi:glutaminyl-peptide cyclotransferase
MVNLIARLEGSGQKRIALATHYDTKLIPGVPDFAGANDGGSGTAVLLELARVLGRSPQRAAGYSLLFFDGEEARGPRITSEDGLYGSRALAREMQASGELDSLGAFVLVDMVGDADLDLSLDSASAPELVELVREAASALGVEGALAGPAVALIDDHVPFVERGLSPVLALIDFRFGARWMPGPRWHTAGDTLEAVSVESLNTVGRLLVEFLARLEGRLRAGTVQSAPDGLTWVHGQAARVGDRNTSRRGCPPRSERGLACAL